MTLPPVIGDLLPLAPMIVLVAFAAGVLLFGVVNRERAVLGSLALVGVLTALLVAVYLFMTAVAEGRGTQALGGSFLVDGLGAALTIVILVGAALALLVADGHAHRLKLDQPEFFPLLLLATAGAVTMVSAGNLIVLLLGLEILSLAVYVLAAWREGSRAGEEAGMKYFLLGAFASAILVYGIALTYGATGRFDFAGIAAALAAPGFDALGLAFLGGTFLVVGLGFKVAFVPFHQWAPDVYTGAPTPVTAFMSVVVKTAAFGALLRVVGAVVEALGPGAYLETFVGVLTVLVGATLVVGNTGALLQSGVKRMLAYSAVAHAGYVGLAVLAGGADGARAAAAYLLAYTFVNLLAFAVLIMLMGDDDQGDRLERLAGLGRRYPWLAGALTLSMLGLAGFPPLVGFVGKFAVFQAAIAEGYVALAVLGIATSVVAVVFYGRVVVTLYLRDPDHHAATSHRAPRTSAAVALMATGVVLLGLFPGWWLDLLARVPMYLGGA